MKTNQSGFSLIELLLVVVIIGVIAAIAVPSLVKVRATAENGSAFSAMRTLSTLQISYYSQNSRYGKLNEVLDNQQVRMGVLADNVLTRGKFSYQMSPLDPPVEDLKKGFTIVATRAATGTETPYVLELTQDGTITPVIVP